MSIPLRYIQPKTENLSTGVIVLLHGWGADSEDLASLIPILDLPDYHFLCPDAPFAHPYSLSGKMWYDFEQMSSDFRLDDSQLIASQEILTELIAYIPEITGLPIEKTILAGFSQGGAMTFDVGLKLPLAGLISMSGYLHPQSAIANTPPPVLMVHGLQDPVVPIAQAIAAKDQLAAMGVQIEYHALPMGHTIDMTVIDLFRNFVQKVITG